MRRRLFGLATLAAGLMSVLAHAQQGGGPPGGGLTPTVVFDPASAGTGALYALAGGRIFKSTNQGATWTANAKAGLGLTNLSGMLQTVPVGRLAIDPNNSATIYAGSGGGGVFKTSDAGGTWTPVNSGLPGFRSSCAAAPGPPGFDTHVLAIVIDPSNSATVYAVVSSRTFPFGFGLGKGGGVFKSTDGGGSWTPANSGLTNVEALAIDPTNPNTLYAGTVPGGIFKSIDGGASWNSVNFTIASTDITELVVDPVNSGTVYAVARNHVFQKSCSGIVNGTDSGIFKTTDGGGSWVAMNSGLPTFAGFGLPNAIIINSLAIDPVNSNNLYTAASGDSAQGVFKSTDGGANWAAASSGLTDDPSLGPLLTAALTVDPSNPATVFAGTRGGSVFKTTDGAASWTDTTSNLTAASVASLLVNPSNPATIYAGGGWNGDGLPVFKSTDGGSGWAPAHSGLPDTFSSLAMDPSTTTTLYAGLTFSFLGGGGANRVFKSTDGGGSWFAASSGISSQGGVPALVVNPANSSEVYAGTSDAGIFKTVDGGVSWSAINNGLPGGLLVNSLAITPSAPSAIYAATPPGVFKSTDGGANWAAVSSGLPAFLTMNALVIDPITTSTIYAGSFNGGVYKSLNGGGTWAAAGLTNSLVFAMAIDPSNPAIVYVGTLGEGVFKSTDGAGTWTAVNVGLSTIDKTVLDVFSLAIDPVTHTTLYAGTQTAGVFKSTGGGATWQATGLLAQLQTLQSIIQSLSSPGGPLNQGQGNALLQKLALAQASLSVLSGPGAPVGAALEKSRPDSTLSTTRQGGKTNAACNLLSAFVNQVNSFVAEGLLTAAQGNQLLSLEQTISKLIPCAG